MYNFLQNDAFFTNFGAKLLYFFHFSNKNTTFAQNFIKNS